MPCSYNCSHSPETIESYPDISGIGVRLPPPQRTFLHAASPPCHISFLPHPHPHRTPQTLKPNRTKPTHQVIISFVTTAYLTVGILLGYYIFAFQPELDPFRKHDGIGGRTVQRANPVDKLVLGAIRGVFRGAKRGRGCEGRRLERAFEKVSSQPGEEHLAPLVWNNQILCV